MTTANWITVLVTLVALAATWGEVRARLKAVESLSKKAAADLEKSRATQGTRIGELAEKWSEHFREMSDRVSRTEGAIGLKSAGRNRSFTLGGGVPIQPAGREESGADE